MKRLAIHGLDINESSYDYIAGLFKNLIERKTEIVLTDALLRANRDFLSRWDFEKFDPGNIADIDAFLSLGGDGTILDTLTLVGREETPILGINTGKLGFLATIAKEQISNAMELLFHGNYSIDKRTLISLETEKDLFNGKSYALNEFSILRRETSSMIVIRAFLNGELLNTYWADGLMVATPTGSTGYSLSCGGPILVPHTSNFVITPVSPHNLNVRPLIVPDVSELTFEVESSDTNYLIALDSRSIPVTGSMMLKVRKADFCANLIKIEGDNFIDTLKNKLSWGLDKRN